MARNIVALIRRIAREQGLTSAQTAALIATARVESTLNPRAVGDGGTSYGLFQHHVGGAGGSSHESARRYLDPVTSITERARWFRDRNITDGRGAAALQRPADPSGYAVKVNRALGGGGAELNAPIESSGPAPASASSSTNPYEQRRARLKATREKLTGSAEKKAEKDSLQSATESLRSKRESLRQSMMPDDVDAGGPIPGGGPDGGSYRDILSFAQNQFGLRIDGSNQTTGGRHAAGSYHYSGRAVDFGDAKNSPEQLRRLARWARANRSRIKEFFYDPLGWYIKDGKIIRGSIGGHGDHVHIAM